MVRVTVAVFAATTARSLALQRGLGSQGSTTLSKASGNGLAECPCVGITGIDGTINVTIDGSPVSYPSDVGTRCEAWDDGLYSVACERGGEPGKGHGWCAQKWCYVDPCACEGGSPNKVSFELDARYKGNPLYYSYETCGSEDLYTAWLADHEEALHQNGKKAKRSHGKKADGSDSKDSVASATKGDDESAAGDLTAEAAPTETDISEGEAAHPEAAEATEVSATTEEASSGKEPTGQHSGDNPVQKASKGWTAPDSSKGEQASTKAWTKPDEQSASGKSDGWAAVKSAIARKASSAAGNPDKPGSAQKQNVDSKPGSVEGQATGWKHSEGAESSKEHNQDSSAAASPQQKKDDSSHRSEDWTAKGPAASKDDRKGGSKDSTPAREWTGDSSSPASNAQDTWDSAKDGSERKGGSSSQASKASETWDSKAGSESRNEKSDSSSSESPMRRNKDASAATAAPSPKKASKTQSSEGWTTKVASASNDEKRDSSSPAASNEHESWSSPTEAAKAVEDVAPLDASSVVPKTDEAETGAKGDGDEKGEEKEESNDAADDEPVPTKAHHTNPNFAAMCSKSHDDKKVGKGSCECIGIAKKQQGSLELSIEGNTVVFPADLGSSCSAWDQDTHPDCVSNGTSTVPDWCQESWCYVDPCSCDQKMVRADKKKGYLPKASADGKQLFYSYKTCGSVDHWTADNNEAACSNMKSEEECSGDCVWMGKTCKDQMQMDMCGTTDTLHSGASAPCLWQALFVGAAAVASATTL